MLDKIFVKYKWDKPFFVFTMLLVAIGVVIVYSSSYFEIGYKGNNQNALIKKELVFVAIGFVAMWFVSKINYKLLRKLVVPINLLAISTYILLIPKLGMSIEFRGGTRWLKIGGFQFMPSDIAKYALILTLAYLLSMNKKEKEQTFLNMFLRICPIIYIVGTILQPDYSTAAVIVASLVAVFYLAGLKNGVIFVMLGAASSVMGLLVMSSGARLERIKVFLNPFIDPTGTGYQPIQSLVAIASGGLGGVGLGNSKQKMLYLPLAYNDYIFSIYAEELGFIGSVILVGIYAGLVYRGFKIISNAPDKFATLLAGGIIAQIALQSIVNLYVAVNLMPSTGINLPLISYGGTSLVTTMMALGIVLGISRFENKVVPVAFKPVQEKRYHSLESRDRR